MKKAIAAAIVLLFAMTLMVPLLPGSYQQPPAARREPGPEPMVPFRESATGNRYEIPMEEYVTGVVAAEMDESFPEAALAAQAILARTYTLRRNQQGDWATDDVRLFQAYDPTRIGEKVRKAAADTRGIVVVHEGTLIDAVYHACAGGRTAGATEGLQAPERAYLQPVDDPPCARDETWTVGFSPDEWRAAAGMQEPVRSVAIGRRGGSGRAQTLVVNGREVSAFEMRRRLGGTRMKSTYLTDVRLSEGRVVVSGRGYGHGVGLSQWGAAALAIQGLTAEQIIRHYFRNVTLERWW